MKERLLLSKISKTLRVNIFTKTRVKMPLSKVTFTYLIPCNSTNSTVDLDGLVTCSSSPHVNVSLKMLHLKFLLVTIATVAKME